MNPYKIAAQEILTICWRVWKIWQLWGKFLKIGKFPAIFTARAIFLTAVGILLILLILAVATAILPFALIFDRFGHAGCVLLCAVLFVVLWLVRSGFSS